ncbi:IscS subfamily cysteine desulfurase [Shouchella shacheensis]|uniref:IscS subfamily cysteine desulfurase n=1 Tax=Shouchella shacheensis TaxID=1649580 RepID=UPI001FDFCC69|nr:IscS subfamily cysteine desulfurase [Shouchella shacheensis]
MDYSATTPLSEECLHVYGETAKLAFANSSSVHTMGLEAQTVLEKTRSNMADLLGRSSDELYFTGSGSEANFLSLVTLANAHARKGLHILSTKTEHPSVHEALDYLKNENFEVTYVPVTKDGIISKEALLEAIRPDTILASFAHASSEVGTIQDLHVLGKLLQARGILLHSDCVQTIGKVPVPLDMLSAASFSAHKLYAPKGLGAAYISNRVHWFPFYAHASHESQFRPGTVDVPGIAAFGKGLSDALKTEKEQMNTLCTWRNNALHRLLGSGKFALIGHPTRRLPFHMGLRVLRGSGQQFMLECDRQGLAIATGSACRVGQTAPSEALLALGLTSEEIDQYVRITFGTPTSEAEVMEMVDICLKIVNE